MRFLRSYAVAWLLATHASASVVSRVGLAARQETSEDNTLQEATSSTQVEVATPDTSASSLTASSGSGTGDAASSLPSASSTTTITVKGETIACFNKPTGSTTQPPLSTSVSNDILTIYTTMEPPCQGPYDGEEYSIAASYASDLAATTHQPKVTVTKQVTVTQTVLQFSDNVFTLQIETPMESMSTDSVTESGASETGGTQELTTTIASTTLETSIVMAETGTESQTPSGSSVEPAEVAGTDSSAAETSDLTANEIVSSTLTVSPVPTASPPPTVLRRAQLNARDQQQIKPDHWYRLRNSHSGNDLVLDIDDQNGKISRDLAMALSRGDTNPGELWQFIPLPSSRQSEISLARLPSPGSVSGGITQYWITNLKLRSRLEMAGRQESVPSVAIPNDDYLGQRWSVELLGDGYFRLSNEMDGWETALTASESAKVVMGLENGKNNGQHWMIEEVRKIDEPEWVTAAASTTQDSSATATSTATTGNSASASPTVFTKRLVNKFLGNGYAMDISHADQRVLYMAEIVDYAGQAWEFIPIPKYLQTPKQSSRTQYWISNSYLGRANRIRVDASSVALRMAVADDEDVGQRWILKQLGNLTHPYFTLEVESKGDNYSLSVEKNSNEEFMRDTSLGYSFNEIWFLQDIPKITDRGLAARQAAKGNERDVHPEGDDPSTPSKKGEPLRVVARNQDEDAESDATTATTSRPHPLPTPHLAARPDPLAPAPGQRTNQSANPHKRADSPSSSRHAKYARADAVDEAENAHQGRAIVTVTEASGPATTVVVPVVVAPFGSGVKTTVLVTHTTGVARRADPTEAVGGSSDDDDVAMVARHEEEGNATGSSHGDHTHTHTHPCPTSGAAKAGTWAGTMAGIVGAAVGVLALG